jgi:hypothetical protein
MRRIEDKYEGEDCICVRGFRRRSVKSGRYKGAMNAICQRSCRREFKRAGTHRTLQISNYKGRAPG